MDSQSLPNNYNIHTIELPYKFSFKTLHTAYLDEIYNLLTNHYIEDLHNITRTMYSRDYLYWYIKNIPIGLVVGLIYKNKLVGLITAKPIEIIVDDNIMKTAIINFLCVQTKIRKKGLAKFLVQEIQNRLNKMGIKSASYSVGIETVKKLCVIKNYAIPINYSKLKNLEFLQDDLPEISKFHDNPLQLMTRLDIESIAQRLDNYLKKFKIRQYFQKELIEYYFLPKKNIVYSFVAKKSNVVTDFIVVYKSYLYCKEKHKMINVANLAYYYCESLTLTELVKYLLDRLQDLGFDQLNYNNLGDNDHINITHFEVSENNYCLHDILLDKLGTGEFPDSQKINSENLFLHQY